MKCATPMKMHIAEIVWVISTQTVGIAQTEKLLPRLSHKKSGTGAGKKLDYYILKVLYFLAVASLNTK